MDRENTTPLSGGTVVAGGSTDVPVCSMVHLLVGKLIEERTMVKNIDGGNGTTGLTKAHKKNFDTLLRAVRDSNVALLHAYDKTLERSTALICAVNREKESGAVEFVPLAIAVDENPYERFLPPKEGGGFCQ